MKRHFSFLTIPFPISHKLIKPLLISQVTTFHFSDYDSSFLIPQSPFLSPQLPFPRSQYFTSQVTIFHSPGYNLPFLRLHSPAFSSQGQTKTGTGLAHSPGYNLPFLRLQLFISQVALFHFSGYNASVLMFHSPFPHFSYPIPHPPFLICLLPIFNMIR